KPRTLSKRDNRRCRPLHDPRSRSRELPLVRMAEARALRLFQPTLSYEVRRLRQGHHAGPFFNTNGHGHRHSRRREVIMKTMLISLTLFLGTALEQEPARGVTRGRVVRADNGAAIGDADVTLQATNNVGKNAEVARTTSGNDGRFTFVGVAAGKYKL